MSSDALSHALSQRRGRGIDPSMIRLGPENASHDISQESKPQDVRMGFQVSNGGNVGIGQQDPSHAAADSKGGLNASSDGGERHGTPNDVEPTQYDRESPTHKDEHTPAVHEGKSPSPPASRQNLSHQDEHTPAVNEQHEMRDAVTGRATLEEYEAMKDTHPRSLGERAKMMALKDQYAKG